MSPESFLVGTATHIPATLHQFLVSSFPVVAWTHIHLLTYTWTPIKYPASLARRVKSSSSSTSECYSASVLLEFLLRFR